jgi:hypothetical protein
LEARVFWIVAAAVVVIACAMAWWTSGRAEPGFARQRAIDIGAAEGKSRSQVTGIQDDRPPGT